MDHPKHRQDEDGTLWLNFGEYGGEVEVAAFSGDGTRVLTVRDVGVACVWNVETGAQLGEIRPTSPLEDAGDASPFGGDFDVFIESAALDTTGELALLGLNDGRAVVHRVSDGELVSVLMAPGAEELGFSVIRSVDYSPDGSYALVGFPGRRVGVWNADGTKLVAFLGAPSGNRHLGYAMVRDTLTTSVAMSPDGRFVFAGANDMTACVFELATGESVFEAVEHADKVVALHESEDVVGWATTGGSVWLSGEKGAQKVLATADNWREVVFDDGRLIARTSHGAVRIWTFDGRENECFVPESPTYGRWSDRAQTLTLTSTTAVFPTGGHRLVVRRGDKQCSIKRDNHLIRVALSPCGGFVATDGWADFVELWDARTGELVRKLDCPGGSGCFDISPGGEWLATGEIGHGGGRYPRSVFVYGVDTGELVAQLEAHDWQIRQVGFSPDGCWLASVGDSLMIWPVDEGGIADEPTRRLKLDRSIGAIVWRQAGLVLVDEGEVTVFDGVESIATYPAPVGYGTVWRLSADEQYLLVSGNQAVVRVDLDDGTWTTVSADIERPTFIPRHEVARELGVRTNASFVWRTPFGNFVHQGDGPRGWIERIHKFGDRMALPCRDGASLFAIQSEGLSSETTMPFEGKMRASWVGEHVLMVNHDGRIFRG